MLIQQSMTGGQLDPGEAGMLTGVFHLHEQQARQVCAHLPAAGEGGQGRHRALVGEAHELLVGGERQDRRQPLVGHVPDVEARAAVEPATQSEKAMNDASMRCGRISTSSTRRTTQGFPMHDPCQSAMQRRNAGFRRFFRDVSELSRGVLT